MLVKHGESKLLSKCSLPLTGVNCITKVITDLAYLEIESGEFILKERAPGVSVQEIKEKNSRGAENRGRCARNEVLANLSFFFFDYGLNVNTGVVTAYFYIVASILSY